MKTILIINTIVLAIAAVAIIALTCLWLRAERKLARHGESKAFKKKGGDRT